MPKYIGPFRIKEAYPESSSYVLDLLPEMAERRIHPWFHVSLLQPYEPNDDILFPHWEARAFYDLGYDLGADDSMEWLVDEIIGHEWQGNKCCFHVRWTLGDHTWEPYDNCKDLAALNGYCQLMGIDNWQLLPKKPKKAKA